MFEGEVDEGFVDVEDVEELFGVFFLVGGLEVVVDVVCYNGYVGVVVVGYVFLFCGDELMGVLWWFVLLVG